MLLAIYVGLVLILFLMGCAVPYSLGITAVVGMIYSGNGFGFSQAQTVTSKMAAGVNSFTLMAIPLFLLSGKLIQQRVPVDGSWSLLDVPMGSHQVEVIIIDFVKTHQFLMDTLMPN